MQLEEVENSSFTLLEIMPALIVIAVVVRFGTTSANGAGDPLVTELGDGFVSGTAQVNGTSLHYVRGGTGPALILVHGFPQDWYEYHAIMPRLAKRFTVVAVDLRGLGASKATADGYDAANMAEDVHQLVTTLKLDHVYIVGHDIGGMVTYACASIGSAAERRHRRHRRQCQQLKLRERGNTPVS